MHTVQSRCLMEKGTDSTKNDLISAVRSVREKLGDSQQTFAGKLGIAIRSLAYYESDRVPRGRTLARLAQLANEAGLKSEEDLFRSAVRNEIKNTLVSS